MAVAPVEPLHTLSWVKRVEVGSSALAAWPARRVATVKCFEPCTDGRRLFYLCGRRILFRKTRQIAETEIQSSGNLEEFTLQPHKPISRIIPTGLGLKR